MKKNTFLSILLAFMSLSSFAQTVLSGNQDIDKKKVDGYYITLPIDEKFIKKEWAFYLGSYGKVNSSREVISVASAKLQGVSDNPVKVNSKISSSKGKTTIFMGIDTGNENYVMPSNKEASVAIEKLLSDFSAKATFNEELRMVEGDLNTAQKNQEKTVKQGEKLAKEKEKLIKKIEDAKAELEQTIKELEQNGKDIETVKITVADKSKAVEQVRTKMPK